MILSQGQSKEQTMEKGQIHTMKNVSGPFFGIDDLIQDDLFCQLQLFANYFPQRFFQKLGF